MLTTDFDPSRKAIINPEDVTQPVPGFPACAIGAFSDTIVAQAVREYAGTKIAEIHCAAGVIPIYRIEKNGKPYALFLAYIGGPMIAGQIEELYAMGAKALVLFGSCGVLDKALDHSSIIVPTKAQRDEGVSYHYLPAAEFVELPYAGYAMRALEYLKCPHVAGPVWTTDAIYRETPARMEKRKAQGCIAVEMECASAAAVAQFRGIPFAQFLFAADNLDSPQWEKRNLGDKGIHAYDRYMEAAFAICNELKKTLKQ